MQQTREKKYKLSDFFRAHWEDYLKKPKAPILPEQFKAVNAILSCRTPKLGTDLYKCPDCDHEKFVYHSCRNRFCPTCGYMDTLKWADRMIASMVDKPHHHVVITMPDKFRDLAKMNRKSMYTAIMKTASDAFKEWFRARWNFEPGIMAVLHTFGEDKKYHVHVHMIMTAGGVHLKTGKYIQINTSRWFVKYDWFVNEKFKPRFKAAINRLYKNGTLVHDFQNRKQFEQFLDQDNNKPWTMNVENPMNDIEHIIKYTGRYTKRACLSEYKITEIDGEYISFICKDYKNSPDKKKPIEVIKKFHYRDFFPRLLQHVQEKNFRVVRYYGLYSNLKKVPVMLKKSKDVIEKIRDRELKELVNYESPLDCPMCKTRMKYQETLFDTRKRTWNQFRQFKIPSQEDLLAKFILEKRKIKQCA